MTPYEQYSLRLLILIASELSALNAATGARMSEESRNSMNELAQSRNNTLIELMAEITNHINALKE